MIYRPLKTNYLAQTFGENRVPMYKEWGMKGHNGEDWVCPNGEPIYHSGDWDGVAKTEVDRTGGIGVDVFSDHPQIGDNLIKLRYWHLKKVNVYDGQKVRFGQLIGWADTTGTATGPHLHFGLKLVDKNGVTLNQDNGYFGGVMMKPWFENAFVLDILDVKAQMLTLIELAKKAIFMAQQFLKGRLNK